MARDEAYLEAEKKIEEARRSGAKELDLGISWRSMRFVRLAALNELPESIGQLKQLQSLNLSNNRLRALPDSVGQLTQLKELNISENHLIALPESLRPLDHLETLILFGNKLTILPEWIGNLTQLTTLVLHSNKLSSLPSSIGKLQQLTILALQLNQLVNLPEEFGNLSNLTQLNLGDAGGGNALINVPECIKNLTKLRILYLKDCGLSSIPAWVNRLENLKELSLAHNFIIDLPFSLAQLEHLENLNLDENPLNPELAEAYEQGLEAFRAYLRAKAGVQIKLNEAKLVLVGEGEVGKSCLMDGLLDWEWQDHPSTHGIDIQQIKVTNAESETEITLNGWDFGGQRVYRPTHQLFFSAPAVYLVVWKPRGGPQQGLVKEWIQLIKRREPTAKILVVATHGGPQQRQPDIDRQELWDLFSKESVVDFFWVDSKPDKNGKRKGIEELKLAIAKVAADLPEVGRSVPKSFQDVREALKERNVPYLSLDEVLAICRAHDMDDEIARLFITISHRLGHLTHYENDPALRDIVILRPDWLATAMSYVLDDEQTRDNQGLVKFSRLSLLWNDPARPADTRYPEPLHRIFLRLMERFDLSYRVAGLSKDEESNPVSLIAQLVPDTTPTEEKYNKVWSPELALGDIQQTQICRIVDTQNGQSANAEGLFYQLIVRLHKFSLGRAHWDDSVHWQRGLILDDEYNGRALLRHVGNDVHITVRAPYPERFLAMLTEEVKYLVESFWEGLSCDVMVPCIEPCGRYAPGTGLFEVEKLIESKRRKRNEYPCPVCNEWLNIDSLLRNAPSAQSDVTALIFTEFASVKEELAKARQQISYLGEKTMGRFDRLDDRTRRTLSRVDKTYTDFLHILTDEAKEGPRLFSLVPVDRSNFNPQEWIRAKFRLTLWCEHSRLPLPALNDKDSKKGVYEIELEREWFKKAGPYLKLLIGTLSLVLPIASSAVKLTLDDIAYKAIEEQLDFGKNVIDATIGWGTKIGEFMNEVDTVTLEHGEAIRAQGANLRELRAWLKTKDPGFGSLVRVMNKRQEFLWVHEKFAGEY